MDRLVLSVFCLQGVTGWLLVHGALGFGEETSNKERGSMDCDREGDIGNNIFSGEDGLEGMLPPKRWESSSKILEGLEQSVSCFVSSTLDRGEGRRVS